MSHIYRCRWRQARLFTARGATLYKTYIRRIHKGLISYTSEDLHQILYTFQNYPISSRPSACICSVLSKNPQTNFNWKLPQRFSTYTSRSGSAEPPPRHFGLSNLKQGIDRQLGSPPHQVLPIQISDNICHLLLLATSLSGLPAWLVFMSFYKKRLCYQKPKDPICGK